MRDVLRHAGVFATSFGFLLATAMPCLGQGMGLGNNRSHPELTWYERETEHFIVVYHQGLEELAVKAATIAEQVYEPITRGLEIEMADKTSIFLSQEDQIINGFALPRKMFIWVNQNDYAGWPGSTDKWLRLVIAHEFQHNVWMEAAQDWTGLFGMIGTPSWFVEGLAEYETEEWGSRRSDMTVRDHILRNRHQDLDPHDSGFSRIRYLAETYGDSVIVNAVKKRNWLGLSNFEGGFEESAGISMEDFLEEWRRAATAYTYSVFGQKEAVDDVGQFMEPPVRRRLSALAYSPDGAKIAALHQPYYSLPTLSVVINDSTKQSVEIDHGILGSDLGFSGDGRHLVYSKMHRGAHGGLVWDLKVADVLTGDTHWITRNRRAGHPNWSPTEERIVFTGIDGSTTNLYTCDPYGEDIRQLTHHDDDVQVLTPRYSPDGKQLVYSRFDQGRGVDLRVMDVATQESRFITQSKSHDLSPFWSVDGETIFFTSDRNPDEVINVYSVPANGNEGDVVAMTDVGEAIEGLAVDPLSGNVVGLALASVDTVRTRSFDPGRSVDVVNPQVDPRYTSWRDRIPPNPIAEIDYDRPPEMTEPRRYRAHRRIRPFQYMLWPSPEPWGIVAGGIWADIAHRNVWTLAFDAGTRDDTFKFRGVYGSWNTAAPLGLPGYLFMSAGTSVGFFGQIYGGEFLYDYRDSGTVRWSQELNFGEHLYANHQVEMGYRWSRFELETEDLDLMAIENDGLELPAIDYDEAILDITYRYTKSRPHRRLGAHATRGRGILARLEWADEAWGSDTNFKRASVDATRLFKFPILNRNLMARARYQSTWGDPAPQDFTGLRADVPILPTAYGGSAFSDDLVYTAPGYFLRGFPRNVPGDRALMATLEWRQPLLPPLPINVLGLTPGGITGVLFYEQGRVWDDGDEIAAQHTVGWELRAPLNVFGSVLVVPAFGEGQTLDWENEGQSVLKDEYFMMSFVQPF